MIKTDNDDNIMTTALQTLRLPSMVFNSRVKVGTTSRLSYFNSKSYVSIQSARGGTGDSSRGDRPVGGSFKTKWARNQTIHNPCKVKDLSTQAVLLFVILRLHCSGERFWHITYTRTTYDKRPSSKVLRECCENEHFTHGLRPREPSAEC